MKKTILMIGGNRGIGAELRDSLISEGHHVIQWTRNVEGSSSENHTLMNFNVENDDLPGELPESIDGYVYLPGSINLRPFERYKEEEFVNDFNLNALHNVKILQKVMPHLKKSKNDPSVVFFSTVAVQSGLPFHASIAMAKGALEGLTTSLAAEYAPKIRFNCIAPGLTDTPLAEKLTSNEKVREASEKKHPLGRIGNPKDIAAMASFLLNDRSSWMTGQILRVDGGMSSIRK